MKDLFSHTVCATCLTWRRWTRLSTIVLAGAVVVAFSIVGHAAERNEPVTFEKHVRPILKANCFHCHGEEEEIESGLDLRLRQLIVGGGDSGPAIVPGDPEASLLYVRVRDGEMPPGENKLPVASVNIIRRWIADGAKTLRPEPTEITRELRITTEERQFWSFQPIRKPNAPHVDPGLRGRTPIDAFVLARLQAHDLGFAPEADKTVLLRRAFFDLIGLPPMPTETEQFVADDSPEAYSRLIDRLLDSPHYGERWGRHWLDVAGYADSEGYTDEDRERPWAYHYRNYVIRSLNADVPWDQFIREQLAGDEMVTPPYQDLDPVEFDRLAATGFLRMAPDGTATGGIDLPLAQNKVIADTIKIVSTSLLGLSVGCAQCHNHRYDPIPQEDYYSFRAIFEPAYNPQSWRSPFGRQISLYTDAQRATAEKIETEEVKPVRDRFENRRRELIEITFQRELKKVPEEKRAAARKAWETPADKRTPDQKELFRVYPSLNVNNGTLYLYDQAAADELIKIEKKIAAAADTKPKQEYLRALTEIPGEKLPETRVFSRGDHTQPRDAVSPGELTVLQSDTFEVPVNDEALPSTGRRLAYANWLTSGKHPLVARVLVNRVWLHHFGRGLVETPSDFGFLGAKPTHPELLDWLATEFIASGWSLKHLHRLIMTSSVYRQASQSTPELSAHSETVDPENRLYWRKSIRRLEAETVRDTVLAVSGKLNRKMFGPPVPVTPNTAGQYVIGTGGRGGELDPDTDLDGEESRRSLYVQVRRSRPLSVLRTFDSPRMEPNCEVRSFSTVAPQSLLFMNSDFSIQQSEAFAQRLREAAPDDLAAQVRRGWKLAFARAPSEEELTEALAFIEEQTAHFTEHPPAEKKSEKDSEKESERPPEFYGLANFCQTLVSSNEFLYID